MGFLVLPDLFKFNWRERTSQHYWIVWSINIFFYVFWYPLISPKYTLEIFSAGALFIIISCFDSVNCELFYILFPVPGIIPHYHSHHSSVIFCTGSLTSLEKLCQLLCSYSACSPSGPIQEAQDVLSQPEKKKTPPPPIRWIWWTKKVSDPTVFPALFSAWDSPAVMAVASYRYGYCDWLWGWFYCATHYQGCFPARVNKGGWIQATGRLLQWQ